MYYSIDFFETQAFFPAFLQFSHEKEKETLKQQKRTQNAFAFSSKMLVDPVDQHPSLVNAAVVRNVDRLIGSFQMIGLRIIPISALVHLRKTEKRNLSAAEHAV